MKKKLSLLLATIMVATMVPVTAFAATENYINRIANGAEDDKFVGSAAPVLVVKDKNTDLFGDQQFELSLTGAEWVKDAGYFDATSGAYPGVTLNGAAVSGVTYYKVSDTELVINVADGTVIGDAEQTLNFPLHVELKDEGEAKVTIVPTSGSNLSGGTYVIANVSTGSTKTTISGSTDITEVYKEIKTITITETTKATIESGDTIKLKLNSGFKFNQSATPTVADILSGGLTFSNIDVDEDEITFTVSGTSTTATKIAITGIEIAVDDAALGKIAEITISGAGTNKETIEVAKAVDYGYSFETKDETLPTLIAGRGNDEDETLKVTFKEIIADSIISGRKIMLTFPEGVEPLDVDFSKIKGASTIVIDSIEDNEMEITINRSGSSKVEFDAEFNLSISPDFTGDIDVTMSGRGVSNEELTATIATAVAPVTITSETNSVAIDYRNVAIGDITITENVAGALQKDKTLYLQVEDMKFETGIEFEILEGDIRVEEVKKTGGQIAITIKSESSKTPAVIKITGLELYLNRSLPAGDYPLQVVTSEVTRTSGDATSGWTLSDSDNAYIQNYAGSSSDAKDTPLFNIDKVTVIPNFVKVATAGRDQDNQFTTQIVVTIGASVLTADGTEIALDVPAFIENGYTMLPVRAVIEALSSVAIVRWDDATKTVTLGFGSRLVSMTVGKTNMNINGVETAMQQPPIIVDSRIFIPLRDLGYALGLNDSKIHWDADTKTATLN